MRYSQPFYVFFLNSDFVIFFFPSIFITDFDLRFFWEWTDFMSYLECMAVFTLIAGLIFYLFIDVPLIVEGYGLVALVTESLLASPQFFRNLKVKSVEGMR